MLVFGRLLRAALSDRNVIRAACIILNFLVASFKEMVKKQVKLILIIHFV